MDLKSKHIAAPALFLSLFLTVASLFSTRPAWGAQPQAVDRRALVHVAYECFHNLIYFLGGSEPFLSHLTPAEKSQFESLGRSIFPTRTLISVGVLVREEGRTSDNVKERLYFSDRALDFIIPPDTTERMAKTTDHIWFNTRMLNDPKTEFELLDALQLIFHEFGHTHSPGQSSAIVDTNNRIAAKMKSFLSPFYRESSIDAETRLKFLTLPFLIGDGHMLDYQFEPIAILDFKGTNVAVKLDQSMMGTYIQGYNPGRNGLHSLTRVTLTPTAEISTAETSKGALMVKWHVEYKNLLRAADQFNFVSLNDSEAKTADQEALPPVIVRKFLYHTIYSSDLIALLSDIDFFQKSIPMRYVSETPILYSPDSSQKWMEALKIVKTEKGRHFLQGVIHTAEPLQQVLLLGDNGTRVLQIPGQVEILTAGYYQLHFSIPETSPAGGQLSLSGIVLNAKKKWDFPELLILPKKPANDISKPKSNSKSKPKLENIYAWDGQDWVSAKSIKSENLDVHTEIKLRYEFSDAPVDMDHLEITWVVHSDIEKESQRHGYKFESEVEIIPGSKLIQRRKGNNLVVEFSSPHKVPVRGPLKVPLNVSQDSRHGYSVKNSIRASVFSILFVDQEFNAVETPMRPFATSWKYVFSAMNPQTKKQFFCRDLIGN
jgi:hypothetical protein